jgi:hypothetical protein
MLQPYALATIPDLRARFSKSGPLDGQESALNEASRKIERVIGRRVVMRAPTEDADALVASVNVNANASGSLTLLAQPGSPGRLPVITVTDPGRALLTAGITVTVTITGTVAGVAGTAQVFDLCQGVSTLYGVKFFTAISAATLTVTGTTVISGASLQIGYSQGYIDYLSPVYGRSDLWLPDWPARQILAVYEDTTRAYDSTTLLVEGTDYEITGNQAGRPDGVLTRIADATGGRSCWACGFEAVKVVWSCGAFTAAEVNPDLKAIAGRTAYSHLSAEQRGTFGASSMSDNGGNVTRFAAPGLSPDDRAELVNFTNFDAERAYRRGFDLEAS